LPGDGYYVGHGESKMLFRGRDAKRAPGLEQLVEEALALAL
jgi:hypothetical protein